MNKLVIVVGVGQDKDGKPLTVADEQHILAAARREVLRIAPGVTVTYGQGSWFAPDASLVEEKVIRLEAFGEFSRKEAQVVAAWIRVEARQECVAFEFTPAVDFLLV